MVGSREYLRERVVGGKEYLYGRIVSGREYLRKRVVAVFDGVPDLVKRIYHLFLDKVGGDDTSAIIMEADDEKLCVRLLGNQRFISLCD